MLARLVVTQHLNVWNALAGRLPGHGVHSNIYSVLRLTVLLRMPPLAEPGADSILADTRYTPALGESLVLVLVLSAQLDSVV